MKKKYCNFLICIICITCLSWGFLYIPVYASPQLIDVAVNTQTLGDGFKIPTLIAEYFFFIIEFIMGFCICTIFCCFIGILINVFNDREISFFLKGIKYSVIIFFICGCIHLVLDTVTWVVNKFDFRGI